MQHKQSDTIYKIKNSSNNLVAEFSGIGLYSESALHSTLKNIYASSPNSKIEVPINRKVVDVETKEEFVEIQTKNLRSITEKILSLACLKPVRIVHPIVIKRKITKLNANDMSIMRQSNSTTRNNFYSLFNELIYAPLIVASPNVRFDILLVDVHEIRVNDGKGSWRRKGERTIQRELDKIEETICINTRDDWKAIIPPNIEAPFCSKTLASTINIKTDTARKILYVFNKAGLISACGKKGNSNFFIFTSY